MVKANLASGRTVSYDLRTEPGRKSWAHDQMDSEFQSQVRALAVHHERLMHTLPLPPRFARVAWTAEAIQEDDGEVVGERISCHADEVIVSFTCYYRATSRITRTDLRRLGKPRYLPEGRPWPQARRED